MAFFSPPLFLFFVPPPAPHLLQRARRWKAPVCWVRRVEKLKFRHGEQFSDLAACVAFLILDSSGHNLPDSHPLVKEHPLAKIMQIASAEHLF